MKKNSFVYVIILVLTLAVTASVFFYYRYYLPNSTITSSYAEFYQEYVASDFNSVNISSINHNVIIRESSDDLIHISFFQKRDNSNIYSTENRRISISIIEKAEEMEAIFNPTAERLKEIIIYLPSSSKLTVINSTVSGDFLLENIALTNVSAESVSGNIEMRGCRFNYISLKSNYGNITMKGNSGEIINAENITGNIMLDLEKSKENYDLEIKNEYGQILFDGERISSEENGNAVYIYEYYQKLDNSAKIKLSAMRGQIAVIFSRED